MSHDTTSEKPFPLENFHPLSLIYCRSDLEAAGADTSLDDTYSLTAEKGNLPPTSRCLRGKVMTCLLFQAGMHFQRCVFKKPSRWCEKK